MFLGPFEGNQTSIPTKTEDSESAEFFQEIHVLFRIFEASTTRRNACLIIYI